MIRTSRLPIVIVALAGCATTPLDAGSDHPHGELPIDERNPIIISNDGPHDNWQGEYAIVLASSGQLKLVGIIVNSAPAYPSLNTNVQGWRTMVKAARDSGMRDIPDPTASVAPALQRPADGNIDSTVPNRSEGARFIVDAAHRLSQPRRPLVVASGGTLTDIADAYLLDPAIAEQVVVVASLGHPTAEGQGAVMGSPNGDLDSWADEIVARRFRYVQVNAYYAQKDDVPAARVPELPANPFGAWMTSKLDDILELHEAADQNSIIASALTSFSLDIEQISEMSTTPPTAGEVPRLAIVGSGRAWLVSRGDNAAATDRFWRALKNPATYGQ